MDGSDFKSAFDVINASKKILLVTHSRPTIDAIASVGALYSLLRNTLDKSVDVAIPSEVSKQMLGVLEKAGLTQEKLLTSLPEKTYTISIKKQGDKIESIKYDESGDVFNFTITPFNGTLDLNSVAINETGANYDLIITVDTPSLNFLGELYKANASVFTDVSTISFDNHKSNTGYATYSLSDKDVDTTSQIILHFAEEERIPVKEDVADILFSGIASSTHLDLKAKIRPSVYMDMGKLVSMGAQPVHTHDALYAPQTLNEIFLVGDILDSANEGTMAKAHDAKVVGCKITLNKEELETVDLDKVAQLVFWNAKIVSTGLGYIIFQKSPQESLAYIYVYDPTISIADAMKELQGKGDKQSGKILFTVDMHAAETRIKDVFGIELVQKAGKFGPGAFADDFDTNFDDFGGDFGDPFMDKPQAAPLFPSPSTATNPFPPAAPAAPVASTPPATGMDNKDKKEEENQAAPARFDPRLGK